MKSVVVVVVVATSELVRAVQYVLVFDSSLFCRRHQHVCRDVVVLYTRSYISTGHNQSEVFVAPFRYLCHYLQYGTIFRNIEEGKQDVYGAKEKRIMI